MAKDDISFDDLPKAGEAGLSFDDLPNKSLSAAEGLVEPITSIPSTWREFSKAGLEQAGTGVGQVESGHPWEMAKGAGNVALGGLGWATSLPNAVLHSLFGRPVGRAVEHVSGSPMAGDIAGTLTDIGAGFALPMPKGIPRTRPLPEAPYGVALTSGERAGSQTMRQAEHGAARAGDPHAVEFFQGREEQLRQAHERIAQGFEPQLGLTIAETPHEAGVLTQEGLRRAEAARRGAVDAAYEHAKSLPGKIHADVFREMPQGLRSDLSYTERPVIVDKETTPFSNKMLDEIDQQSTLGSSNKASPQIQPQEQIAGVNLTNVDQMRKRLSALRSDAYTSGTPADQRAASAIMRGWDNRINMAVNSGQFSGDATAVGAFNNARTMHAAYKRDFFDEQSGKVISKIIGRNTNDVVTPEHVAHYLTGGPGITTTSSNINVANRIKNIFDEDSTEWAGIRQAAFHNAVTRAGGQVPLGTGDIANRVSKLANSDVGRTLYSPEQLGLLQDYANFTRRITMPRGAYVPSGPAIQQAANNAAVWVSRGIGAAIGKALLPWPVVGEITGGAAGGGMTQLIQSMRAASVRRQMPLIEDTMQRWNRAQSALSAAPTSQAARRAAVTATINLHQALGPLGIDLDRVLEQGAAGAQASPQPQQRARGGRIKKDRGKMTHSSVGYVMKSPHRDKSCGLCSMFVPQESACTLVQSPIASGGYCRRFERA